MLITVDDQHVYIACLYLRAILVAVSQSNQQFRDVFVIERTAVKTPFCPVWTTSSDDDDDNDDDDKWICRVCHKESSDALSISPTGGPPDVERMSDAR